MKQNGDDTLKEVDIAAEYSLGMGDSTCEPYPGLDIQGGNGGVASDSDATHAHKFRPIYADKSETAAHVWDQECECGAKRGHAKGAVY
jgi:hypothetical protein